MYKRQNWIVPAPAPPLAACDDGAADGGGCGGAKAAAAAAAAAAADALGGDAIALGPVLCLVVASTAASLRWTLSQLVTQRDGVAPAALLSGSLAVASAALAPVALVF